MNHTTSTLQSDAFERLIAGLVKLALLAVSVYYLRAYLRAATDVLEQLSSAIAR